MKQKGILSKWHNKLFFVPAHRGIAPGAVNDINNRSFKCLLNPDKVNSKVPDVLTV